MLYTSFGSSSYGYASQLDFENIASKQWYQCGSSDYKHIFHNTLDKFFD